MKIRALKYQEFHFICGTVKIRKGRQLPDALSPIIQFILSVLYPIYTPSRQTTLPPQSISTAVYTPSEY